MKFSEWVGISKAYSQRARQGKASELWNRGRRVDPSKVSRQLERYKSEILQHTNGKVHHLFLSYTPLSANSRHLVTTATSVLDPRLSIRTPPPTDRAAHNTPPPSADGWLLARLEDEVSRFPDCVRVERVETSDLDTSAISVPTPGSDLFDMSTDTRLETDIFQLPGCVSLNTIDMSGPNTITVSPFIHTVSHQVARPQHPSDPPLEMDICLNEPLASTPQLDFDFFNSFIHDGQVPEREMWQATMPWFQLENILAVPSKHFHCAVPWFQTSLI